MCPSWMKNTGFEWVLDSCWHGRVSSEGPSVCLPGDRFHSRYMVSQTNVTNLGTQKQNRLKHK